MNAKSVRHMQSSIVASLPGIAIIFALMLRISVANGNRQTMHAETAAMTTKLSLSGEVVKVKDSSFVLNDADSSEVTVSVDDQTMFTLDGNEATLESLKVGFTVNVMLRADGGGNVARAVDDDGLIGLSGTVATSFHKRRAERLAQDVPGAVSVSNEVYAIPSGDTPQ